MYVGNQSVLKKALSPVPILAVCMLLAFVFTLASQAWADTNGVYGFICQKGTDGDYVLVVKNGTGIPDTDEYGTVIKAYPQNLTTLTLADSNRTNSATGGWPWKATDTTLDTDAAAVKKVVVAGEDGSVSLKHANGLFAYFSNCTEFNLAGFFADEIKSVSDVHFQNMFRSVYNATTNNNIIFILGSNNKLQSLGLTSMPLYLKINSTYAISSSSAIPLSTACTLYTQRPADCMITPNLSDYEVTFNSDHPFAFNGTDKQGAEIASVTLKGHPELAIPPEIDKTFEVAKQAGNSWVIGNIAGGIGHYRIRAIAGALSTGYSGSTDFTEFDIIPGGTLELCDDELLQTVVDSESINLTGVTELYVKCNTALSGLNGTIEMKVDAESSDPSVLTVAAVAKIGEYSDGYCVYKITMNPVKEGAADISIWGYVPVVESGHIRTKYKIGTLTKVQPVSVNVLPATLTLGDEAQQTLSNLVLTGDTVVVDLIYEGRPLESINFDTEIIVKNPKKSDDGLYSTPETDFDIATATYDITTGKLSVKPETTKGSNEKTGILRVTVSGAGLYGEATIEIPVTVRRATATVTAKLANGQPLPQPLKLNPGQVREIVLEYSGDAMAINYLINGNPAIADITPHNNKNTDGKSAVLKVKANAASASTVTLGAVVYSTSQSYQSTTYSFVVQVSKADLPLKVTSGSLGLKVGESGKVGVSDDGERVLSWKSSNEDVAQVDFDWETMELCLEALSVGTTTITLGAAENDNLNASEATVQVTVTKAYGVLSVDPAVLELKAGQNDTAEVTYDGDGVVEVTSSDDSVALATFDEDTKKLTVEALAAGTATITISAAETETSEAAEATLQVTVTASGPLSVNPNKLDLKPGQSGIADVTYDGNATIEVKSSNESVAKATYTANTKQLKVEALAAGTATIMLSVEDPDTSEVVEVTLLVTVTNKIVAPPINIDTEYTLVIGEDTWSVTYSEVLDYELVQFSSSIEVVPSNGGKTLTVTPKAKGTATLTISAKETATTQALAPVPIHFTVNEPTKPVQELQPLSLDVGTKIASEIKLVDDYGNAITGTVNVTNTNQQVATASYDKATKKLTITAIAPGETVIGLSSVASKADYTIKVTVLATSEPEFSVVDANKTGVSVTPNFNNFSGGADVTATIKPVASGNAYDNLSAESKLLGNDLLNAYECILTYDGKEVHDGFGSLTLAFPVDASYEGSEVTVVHLHNNGSFSSGRITVKGGKATVKVTDLSTFAITVKGEQSNTVTNNPGSVTTGTGNTASTGSLVSGTGSSGSSNTSGTGSLVSGSGSSGSSNTSGTGSLVTSSGSSGTAGSLSASDGKDTAALADTNTPLASRTSSPGSSDAFADAQSGGLNPWVIATIVALVVVGIGVALWFFLRRRRLRLAELDEVLVAA